MGTMGKTKSAFTSTGRAVNEVLSFIVFSFLDVLDFALCFVYKVIDFIVEAEWKPCYCSSSCGDDAITSNNGGKIVISEPGEAKKIVRLSSSKVQLEDVSDTLYTRSSLVSDISKMIVNGIKKIKVDTTTVTTIKSCENVMNGTGRSRSTYTVNSTIIEMLQEKIRGPKLITMPRWSDCDCNTCNSWTSSCKDTLYVKAEGHNDTAQEDVLFIHGFISSSQIWTETVFPNFSESTKSKYRLLAVDLLGFGRSPKPADSLYTLREHVEMIERSVINKYGVKSFHIVAHSLGCILALALAAKYPGSVKSITLVAPPIFQVPKGEQANQYVMKKIAPRRLFPLIAFGASLACWYEHISRTICFLICKNHRLWEFLTKLVTGNRMKTYLIDGFMCHTHNSAWHTLHNIICGSANKVSEFLDTVQNQVKCDVNLFHGRNDELLPVECSYAVRSKVERANVKNLRGNELKNLQELATTSEALVHKIINEIKLWVNYETTNFIINSYNLYIADSWDLDVSWKQPRMNKYQWKKPPARHYKINTNGSLANLGGFDAITRDANGDLMLL
ncbi:hypothetical protein GIB67_000952 [Kingdonia uniflora]|uniref:AB hydrolase-1 domain-containing protein n=1 Tax=Kingdonia uniflora TaxID=39325 RepID=A0A7J7MFM1_9MAGN|nr:hypothetical protein GIB67_000952 [Kingdonia uniflora]